MPQRISLKHAYRSKHSSRLALSVPIDLKRRMALHRLNWSRLFQAAVRRRLNELERASDADAYLNDHRRLRGTA